MYFIRIYLLFELHSMVLFLIFSAYYQGLPSMLQFENDKWVSPREYLFSMVLYYTLFSNGFYYKNFSSFVMITRMISPVWFAFNGIGSILNLISRLPQYASILKMINGTLLMNTLFSGIISYLYILISESRISVCFTFPM